MSLSADLDQARSGDPAAVARVEQAARTDPRAFAREIAPQLAGLINTKAWPAAARSLLATGLAPETICSPALMHTADAQRAGRALAALDPRLDASIAGWLSRVNFGGGRVIDNAVALRGLEVLEAIGGDSVRVLPLLARLQRAGDARVRSKAAAIMGRSNQNLAWYRSLIAAGDWRPLANAIESLWQSEWPGARDVYEATVKAIDNRVAGNALIGLFRLGDVAQAETRLADMVRSADPAHRATAAWVIGMVNYPPMLPALTHLAHDPDSAVRRNAIRALVRIRRSVPAASEA